MESRKKVTSLKYPLIKVRGTKLNYNFGVSSSELVFHQPLMGEKQEELSNCILLSFL